MPYILIVLGVLLVVVAIRNTQTQLGQQITADFTGPGNFFYWIGALFIIGALGYIDDLRAPSRAMLALVLIAMILSNQGFFAKFMRQLQQGSAQAPPPGPSPPAAGSASGGGGSSSGGGAGSILNPSNIAAAASIIGAL